MTIQPENKKDSNVRDLLVEVNERQTGSLNFGLMAGSDTGLVGNISLINKILMSQIGPKVGKSSGNERHLLVLANSFQWHFNLVTKFLIMKLD